MFPIRVPFFYSRISEGAESPEEKKIESTFMIFSLDNFPRFFPPEFFFWLPACIFDTLRLFLVLPLDHNIIALKADLQLFWMEAGDINLICEISLLTDVHLGSIVSDLLTENFSQ